MSRLVAARHQTQSGKINPLGWMITFSDLMTLILTFYVMIICITSQSPKSLLELGEDLGQFQAVAIGNGVLYFADQGRLAPVVDMVEHLEQLPDNVLFDQEEMKSAIFQLDAAMEPEYRELETVVHEAVDIFKDQRGLVVKWDQEVLFGEGGTVLSPESQKLLDRMAALLVNTTLPVSVESHTNPFSELEGGTGPAGYDLSMTRSRVVMRYLISRGAAEKRFRISGHGGGRPAVEDPALGEENSRLEIILYKPPQSSWSG